MRLIAFVVSGLEEVSVKELKGINSVKILDVRSKRIEFEISDSFEVIKNLRTIDDLGILIHKIFFKELTPDIVFEAFESINLDKYKEFLNSIRSVKNNFSVTVSVYKNNKFNQNLFKSLISDFISKTYGFSYSPLDHTNFDIRVNIDENELLVSTRIFTKPLHQRSYKQNFKSGSLKPTIAGSLVNLLENKQEGKLVDLFCGSGTILCEAYLQGYDIFGSDIDIESCKNTVQNLKNLNFQNFSQIQLYNAASTRWGTHSFDYIVSNLPWNKQVKVERMNELIEKFSFELSRIMKSEFKGVFLINKSDFFVEVLKNTFPKKQISVNKLSFNGQSPDIVILK